MSEAKVSELEDLLAQVATAGDKMATALDLLDTDYENIEFWQAADTALAEWRALVPQQGTARRTLPPSEAIHHGGYTAIKVTPSDDAKLSWPPLSRLIARQPKRPKARRS